MNEDKLMGNREEEELFSDLRLPSTMHSRKHQKKMSRKQRKFLLRFVIVALIFIVSFFVTRVMFLTIL